VVKTTVCVLELLAISVLTSGVEEVNADELESAEVVVGEFVVITELCFTTCSVVDCETEVCVP
jgi:hypothetical protein